MAVVRSDAISERAVKYLVEGGFNGAESVLMSLAESFDIRSDLIPRIATPFGGGISRRGSICGALLGGIMAIGLKHGRSEVKGRHIPPQTVSQEKALELFTRFEKKFGSALCYDLIKVDLATPEGNIEIESIRPKTCADLVRFVVGNVAQLVE